MDYDPWMFQGEIINGRLSNEASLVRDCPAEFFSIDNPWTVCISTLLKNLRDKHTGALLPWEWQKYTGDKRRDEREGQRRENCFRGLLYAHRSGLNNSERTVVLAWMLSEILVSVPSYIPFNPPTYDH